MQLGVDSAAIAMMLRTFLADKKLSKLASFASQEFW